VLADDFEKLNDEQKAIVKGFKGPTMIVAGPGTGKTRTVAVLIGRLLAEGTKLKEILALTFSEKAALELRGRVMEYHPKSYDECWISTFHSFCARVLREQYFRVGIHPEFRLLTGFKEALLMSGICAKLTPETFPVFGRVLTKRGFQLETLTFISLLKSNLVTPDNLREAIACGDIDPRSRRRLDELLLLYEFYEAERRRTGFLDFRDLISLTIDVLRSPDAAARYRRQFRVVLVDEFQDTDPAQYLLLKLLKGEGAGPEPAPRIAVIGDPRQSIYRFRGADPGMMGGKSAFRREFKARLFPLRSNYRSASCILGLAGRLRWSQRFTSDSPPKNAAAPPADELIPRSSRQGFFELLEARDELEESRLVARRIAALLTYGAHRCFAPSEVAVLVRNNYQIDLISESLRALHVPFDIAGDMKFFRSEEVTALASLLQAAANPAEQREQPLRRAFASPIFGLDQIWAQQFLAALPLGVGLEQAADELLGESPNEHDSENPAGPAPETIARLAAFRETLRLLRDGIELPLVSLFARLLLAIPHLLADPAAPGARHVMRFRNMIDDFCDVWEKQHGRPATAIDLMPNFDEWLTYYASTLEQDDDGGAASTPAGVRLMTVHQSKGLEFPVVFVTGLCEGQFPVRLRESLLLGTRGLAALQRAVDAKNREIRFFNPYPADHEDHLEEERRLVYVALTRAEEGLIMTLPRRIGTDPALPAPFLSELGLKPVRDWQERRALTIGELRTRLARLSESARDELRPDLERLTAAADTSDGLREDPLTPRRFGIAPPTPAELPAGFRFSAQSLRDYLDCPRRFFFKHVLRLRDARVEKQAFFVFGNAVHACLEHLHHPEGPFAGGRTPSFEDLDVLWAEYGQPLLEALPVLQRTLYGRQARELLETYREAVYVNGQIPVTGTIGVEAEIRFEFRGHRCKGRIDRWLNAPDDTLWIIDYKTGSSKSGSKLASEAFPEAGPPAEIQLPFYLLAAKCLGHSQVCATTVYPKDDPYKKKYKGFQPGFMKAAMLGLGAGPDWAVQIDPDRFAAFEDTVERLMNDISRNRVFDCAPSAAPSANSCLNRSPNKSCEFQAFCQERLDQLRLPAQEESGIPDAEPD